VRDVLLQHRRLPVEDRHHGGGDTHRHGRVKRDR
jgi:hypothetical protein